jgi:hypothetical protein
MTPCAMPRGRTITHCAPVMRWTVGFVCCSGTVLCADDALCDALCGWPDALVAVQLCAMRFALRSSAQCVRW